jgi:beta-lactamase superfamily II metal-dependent hydrolase
MENLEEMKKDIDTLEENIQSSYPKATIYSLHTGQSYYFSGAEIEILWTVDDTYPAQYTSFNDLSAALRIKFDEGKTVLLLGDCMHEACRRIAHRYGDYLKSDILQVTHHGLIGGDKELYEWIDPEICLWTIAQERFLGLTSNQRYQWCLGEGGCDYNAYLRDETIRKREHVQAGITTRIEI